MLVFRLGLTAARCCPLIFFYLQKSPHIPPSLFACRFEFIDIFDFNPYQDGWGYMTHPLLNYIPGQDPELHP